MTHFQTFAHLSTIDLGAPRPKPTTLTGNQFEASVALFKSNDGLMEIGVWECTPGRWRRQIVAQEFCHFIQGRCTFTPDNGETLHIEAGDALMLPANSTGIWDIQETVRKTYVLIF